MFAYPLKIIRPVTRNTPNFSFGLSIKKKLKNFTFDDDKRMQIL